MAVVAVSGEHDLSTATDLRRALLDATGPAELVVLDLAQCTFLDSTVLGVVVSAWKRMSSAGGRLLAVSASRQVSRVLAITGLDAVLGSVDRDDESALGLEAHALLGQGSA